jgi:tetratricopeptide (TPR) repeat protein
MDAAAAIPGCRVRRPALRPWRALLALVAVLGPAALARAGDGAPPKTAAEFLERGLGLHKAGNLDGAIADYTKAIELDPKDARPYLNRGAARRDRGDVDGAIVDLSKAIELDPKDGVAFNNRGYAKKRKGDVDGAIADYDKAVELAPGYGNAFNNRGEARMEKGDHEGAIADFTRAVELDPRDGNAFANRGDARKETGDLSGALADYDRAVALDSKGGTALMRRGRLRFDTAKYTEAASDLQSSVWLLSEGGTRDYARLYLWLARAFGGRRDSATSELKTWLASLPPARQGTWVPSVARCFVGETKPEALVALADAAPPADREGQRCEAYFYAGMVLLLDGKTDPAVEYLKKCLETQKRDFVEYMSANHVLKRLGK